MISFSSEVVLEVQTSDIAETKKTIEKIDRDISVNISNDDPAIKINLLTRNLLKTPEYSFKP